jgi:hypothetical protein
MPIRMLALLVLVADLLDGPDSVEQRHGRLELAIGHREACFLQ